MSYTKNWFLLQQEGFLIRSCLTTGLTALRLASIENRGAFYTAFFQLSIGLERLMKVTLILDHMLDNELQEPNQEELRAYSHDLVKLLKKVKGIAEKHSFESLADLQSPTLEYNILEFLAKFAQGARYANLDALSGKTSTYDPLVKWNEIIQHLIKKELPKATRERVEREAQNLATLTQGSMIIVYHDMNRQPLLGAGAFVEPQLHRLVAPYAVWYTMQIILPLKQVMVDVSRQVLGLNQAQTPDVTHIPEMREFLSFVSTDRKWVMRKKKWS